MTQALACHLAPEAPQPFFMLQEFMPPAASLTPGAEPTHPTSSAHHADYPHADFIPELSSQNPVCTWEEGEREDRNQ